MDAQIINKKLYMDGFIYYKTTSTAKKIYWECKKYRAGECRARAITNASGSLVILKRPAIDDHLHAPNQHECEAEIAKNDLKREAEANPERPPSAILREKLPKLSLGALAMLPDRENLKKSMRRTKQKDMPSNPQKLEDFDEIPDRYSKTLLDEKFLIHDSGKDPKRRILVFATKFNLEKLSKSETWFLDGTFKVRTFSLYPKFIIFTNFNYFKGCSSYILSILYYHGLG